MDANDRYIVISSDCHAGARMETYKEYLPSTLHDEFESWRAAFVNPFPDLMDIESVRYRRNHDSALRQADLEGDGVVGEIIFPNTIPPFFATVPDLYYSPDVADQHDFDLRWAGLHAHNQWLADFAADVPGRRAGVAQILLEDVDRALEEIRWVGEQPGLFGGILLPNPAADSKVDPIHSAAYEPLWSLCEELGLPINSHGGGGLPYMSMDHEATPMIQFLEFGWYSQRPLVRMLFGGVMERHPGLTFVFTETGNTWVPSTLAELDHMYDLTVSSKKGSIEYYYGEHVRSTMSMRPSEYWARQCYLGASFLSRSDCDHREATGIDRIMWGSDYPHEEGTFPYTDLALRYAFAGIDHDETAQILGLNAARAYKFDTDTLAKAAADIGPRVGELDVPLALEDIPDDNTSMALSTLATPG